jgi:hypothetical protein
MELELGLWELNTPTEVSKYVKMGHFSCQLLQKRGGVSA